jgi:hypothetical protein
MFFFEKKNQKTFVRAVPDPAGARAAAEQTFFASFFQKRRPFFLLLTLLATAAQAQPVEPPTISPPDTWVPRQSGTLRLLNKLDSTVTTLTLHVGQTVQVQSLSITLRGCAVRPPDLPQDATARLSVVDSRSGMPGFEGWILTNEPAAAMLEHPVYDLRLVGCT